MLSLIVTILFGLGVAYFALQNSMNVVIHMWNYTLIGVPVYAVVVISILAGVLISWVISGLNSLAAYLALRGKDKVIKEDKRTISQLRQDLHKLEVENAQLRSTQEDVSEQEEITHDDTYKPNYGAGFLRPA